MPLSQSNAQAKATDSGTALRRSPPRNVLGETVTQGREDRFAHIGRPLARVGSMRRIVLDQAKTALLRRRAELAAYCEGAASSELELFESKEADPLDAGADLALATQIDDLGERERTELMAIDRAIARIKAGTFGACTVCDAPIDEGRLLAFPSTAVCVTCARAREEELHAARTSHRI
jgi:DnaK suppressor protein